MSSSRRCGYKRLFSVAHEMSTDRTEREQRAHSVPTTQPEHVAVQTEPMQQEDATSSTFEQNLALITIEISDAEDEIFYLSDDSEAMDDLDNVEPCATFSIAECFPKQDHVRTMRVLMMVRMMKENRTKSLMRDINCN